MSRAAACWYVDAAEFDGRDERLHALLDDAERERYARFVHDGARRAFLVAHALVRVLLAAEQGCAPREITFALGAFGKPSLMQGNGVTFNATHGDDLVAVAVSRGIEVGVDVERIRPIVERAEIARQFFHPAEARALAALPPADAELAFFRCWTRKEAISKALGLGLSLPLDQYRVTCSTFEAPALLHAAPGMPAPATWSLHDLPLGARAAGAFAGPEPDIALTHRTIDAATFLRAVADPTLLRACAENHSSFPA